LGYNFLSHYDNSLAVRLGYRIEKETKVKDKVSEAPKEEKKEEKKSARFFRPGIEVNYPFWRSSVDYFDNSSPNIAVGGGLFLRIGPDFFYFTTGFYLKTDVLEKHEAVDLEFFKLKLGSLPLMDLRWGRAFAEVPLLLSFGSGQIRFTFGTLLDFYSGGRLDIDILDEKIISLKDAELELIEKRFNENQDGDIYFTLGLDFDIVRHWGLGIKFLVWGSSFGEYKSLIEPARCQTRVSTYFVF
jgi:hypothetical protein